MEDRNSHPQGAEDEPTTVEPMTDVSITFSDVESGGATNVVKTTDAPALPEGFQLGGDGLFYEIQTTVDYDPPITVCFPVADFPEGTTPEILHNEGGTWVAVATTGPGGRRLR